MTFAQVFDRLYNSVHLKAAEHFGAFYSSELGGIVTNPAFMVVHMDDHMVHRKSDWPFNQDPFLYA